MLATEQPIIPPTLSPFAIVDANSEITGSTFDKYRIELGDVVLNHAINFQNEAPSPLFTAPMASSPNGGSPGADNEQGPESNAATSEWDYLWHNASRIPVTSIPEPTAASLLVGGAALFWAGQKRRRIK